MTAANGSPIWTRTSTYLTYGGDPNKRDYGNIGCVNQATDVSAAQLQRMAIDLAAIQQTAALATLLLSCTSGVTTVVACRILWESQSVGTYLGSTPPQGFPLIVDVSSGVIRIKVPSSAVDTSGVSGAIAPVACVPIHASAHWTGVFVTSDPTVVSMEIDSFPNDGSSVEVVIW